jgi:hypothetical protein
MKFKLADWSVVCGTCCIVSFFLFLFACVSGSGDQKSLDTVCEKNLRAIGLLIRLSAPTSPNYPQTFSDLELDTTNINLFICPVTGHKPGNIKKVDEWTDYIYVGGLTQIQDPKVAMLISPSENYNNKKGYILYFSGELEQLPESDIRRLIIEPWYFATNASPYEINILKKQVTVHIPQRLRAYYPNAYKYDATNELNSTRQP